MSSGRRTTDGRYVNGLCGVRLSFVFCCAHFFVRAKMGKKGKKATKQTTGGGGGGDGGDKKKVGPGKARRERAATIRDLEARIAALAEKLDVELEGVDVFSPLEEREDCPVCFVTLPLASDDLEFNACLQSVQFPPECP